MVFLRELKWLLYCVKLLFFFLLGFLVRTASVNSRHAVLTGETTYTGGTFVFFSSTLRLLAEQSFKTTVIIHRRRFEPQLRRLLSENNVPFHVIPSSLPFLEQIIFTFFVLLARASVLISSAGAPGEYTLSLLCGLPSIHVFHSVPEGQIDRRKRRLFRWFFRSPHKIVTVSNFAKTAIVKFFRIPFHARERVLCIYNGVQDCLNAYLVSHETPDHVVTIGHVIGYKNPETWLRTARYVIDHARRPVVFVWLGDGPELLRFSDLVRDTEQIRFAGFQRDISTYLGSAKVYYHPSRLESFGMSVAQALSMGIPCVVSDCGGLPELVTDGKNGFVFPSEDFVSHGKAILRLLDDDSLRARMSSESRKTYVENFTLERWKSEMMKAVAQRG